MKIKEHFKQNKDNNNKMMLGCDEHDKCAEHLMDNNRSYSDWFQSRNSSKVQKRKIAKHIRRLKYDEYIILI